MSTIYQVYGTSGYQLADSLLVGLECEIECLADWSASKMGPEWGVTEDGSLRNSGREFISKPLPIDAAAQAFIRLYSGLVFSDHPEGRFSERTSIHVHVNCQNIEEEHVRNIVLMYALFEEYFFAMVDPHRRENIHCVPLVETFLPTYYSNPLRRMHERWTAHKYTALNIRPLNALGTIEFRHMHGHDDPLLLAQWLGTISNLFSCATKRENQITAETINPANVSKWFDEVFKDSPSCMKLKNALPLMTANQLLDIKLSTMS